MGGEGEEGARYRAFISYSHVDQAFGRRLHRRLERYAIPRRLVGRATARGVTPSRVAPIFRDREELSAADDLTAEVRAALAASGALIVVCSPAAAASPWVAREVELFRQLHPDRPVLAALAAGEPAEAFPAPLTRAGGAAVEPLAADFRAHADGPRLGQLKLVAGVLGLGLDELVQRDAQRRLRNVTAVTAGAVAMAISLSALTAYAVVQGREAQSQRAEAEALVEFMLTDLRDRLKGVGRLDVLTAVNDRTLAYYGEQDIERLPAESQARYARILHAMGEDDMTRGDGGAALAKFQTAARVTSRLMRRSPANPARTWDHGQSEYWLGYHAYDRKDWAEAERRWRAYRALAASLVAESAADPKYRRELGYAEGNLCTLAIRGRPRRPETALQRCRAALSEMEATARLPGRPPGVDDDLINRHAWLADAYAANGDWAAARAQRLAQEQMLDARVAADPLNKDFKETWVALQRGLARAEAELGQMGAARQRLLRAAETVEGLIALDPENQEWRRMQRQLAAALERLSSPAENRRRAP